MNKEIEIIQQKIMTGLDRLDKEDVNISEEVARSNAISQLANTYIKSCNLIIRVEETKVNLRGKIHETSEE
ncbi:MAG: hypothetical protein J6S85_04705 [Methanobrevibacter sp.]|nr:hypothetical protein [Methanobrevibacter sp.]